MNASSGPFRWRLAALLLAILSMWLAPSSAEAQYIGEIRWVAFNRPLDTDVWAECDGRLLEIRQNTALFSLIGTYYGGNGTTNFALPDLRGRAVIGYGNSYSLGQQGGEEAHALTISEMPSHAHSAQMRAYSGPGDVSGPQGATPAQAAGGKPDYSSNTTGTMASDSLVALPTGGSQPHPNMPPYLVLRPVICITGIYPSRN